MACASGPSGMPSPCLIFSWRVVSRMRRVMTRISSSLVTSPTCSRRSARTALSAASVGTLDHLGVHDVRVVRGGEQTLKGSQRLLHLKPDVAADLHLLRSVEPVHARAACAQPDERVDGVHVALLDLGPDS